MLVKTELLDEIALERAIKRISHEIIEKNHGVDTVALVGIVTRGVPMANKIRDNILAIEGKNLLTGKLDITLYRDDLSKVSYDPTVNKTEIDFDIEGKDIVLVDDVIFTGRTVRAAIEAVFKIGRPKTIQLACLIDRGHRELPVRPDYVGKNVPTSLDEIVGVRFKETDGEQRVVLIEKDL